ncbi:MAG: TetR/AcrR family transcriptional regulator [Kofleriaceae bacterium]
MIGAAERVLERDGVRGLTTNRIAEVAGVSIGSIYQYFPNKEAIVAALIDRYAGAIRAGVVAAAAAHGDRPLVELLEHIGAAMVEAWQAQARIHCHLRQLRNFAGVDDQLARALDQLVELVAATIRARFPAVRDPAVTAFAIVHGIDGAVCAFAERAVPSPPFDPATLIGVFVRMIATTLA